MKIILQIMSRLPILAGGTVFLQVITAENVDNCPLVYYNRID